MSADTNIEGKTVIDYLPDGQLLINPFTGARSEPSRWGARAVTIGEIGYACRIIDHEPQGYNISGVGNSSGTIIIDLDN